MRREQKAVYVLRTAKGLFRAPHCPARARCAEGYTDDLGLAERYTEAGAAWLSRCNETVVHERDAEAGW